MIITFDTNRIGTVLLRRFNASWREQGGENVHLLPRVAYELMGQRVRPGNLERDIERVEEDLVAESNALTPKQKMWGLSIAWWGREILREDSPYSLLSFSRQAAEKAEEICERLPREPFLRLGADEPIERHGDAIMVSEALAMNAKVLMTNDSRIHPGGIQAWAEKNAREFELEFPTFLIDQDEFFMSEYSERSDLLELYRTVIGAFWPAEVAAEPENVCAEVERTLEVLMEGESGFKSTSKFILNRLRRDGIKNDIIEYMRERLPQKLRASEARHPTYRQERSEARGMRLATRASRAPASRRSGGS